MNVFSLILFLQQVAANTSGDTIYHVGSGTAIAVLVGKEVLTQLRKVNHKLDRRSRSSDNHTAGAMPVEYWHKEFNDLGDKFGEAVERLGNRLEPHLVDIKTATHETRDLAKELVLREQLKSELKKGASA